MWLQSPTHNRRKEVLALFEYLVTSTQNHDAESSRDAAFVAVQGRDKPYDDLRLRQWCTYLNEATEAWLVYASSAGNEAIGLLTAYRKRQLSRHFEWTYTKALSALERQPFRHYEYHWQRYHLSEERYRWDAQQGRSANLDLGEQEVLLQTAILSTKLRQASLSLAYQQVSGSSVSIPMLESSLDFASQSPYNRMPAIRLYKLIVELYIQSEAGDSFEAFTRELQEYYHLFPTEEARDLLLLGINFGIRWINEGQTFYLRPTLSLYQEGLQRAVLLEGERLDAFAYNNIVGIALRLEELDWVDTFIHDYGRRLSGSLKRAIYQLNVARLAYVRQQYTEALKHLSGIQERDFVPHLTARVLELKVYVEQGDYDMALQHIRNTDAFLKRRHNTAYHTQNYQHILRLTEAYCRLQPLDKTEHKALRNRIQATHPLTERDWLLGLLG